MKRTFLIQKVGDSLRRARIGTPPENRLITTTLLISMLGMALFGLSGLSMFGSDVSDSMRAAILTDGWVIIIKAVAMLVIAASYVRYHSFFRTDLQKLEPSYPAAGDVARFFGKKTGILASLLVGLCFFGSSALVAQSGTAFRDFDGNGVQAAAEPGVEGIVVKLYANATLPAKDQLIGTAVTDAGGNFNFAVNLTSGRAANAGELVRIEFEIPNVYECSLEDDVDFEGLAGAVFGSSVQFITGQQTSIEFAINYPGQWVENPNPDIYLPCYAFGDPFAPGNNVAGDPAFITYKYLQSGVPAGHEGGTPGVPGPIMLSSVAEVGSLYGTAFSRPAQLIFSSAVIRRHCGLGPLGPGGIYLIDPNEPSANKTTNFLDLDAIGIHTWDHSQVAYPPNPGNNTSPVSGFVGTNAQRGLPGDRFQPSTDYAAGDQVGKVSIGDIDISDDGRYLYVMNLWDRKIYEIDLVDARNPQAPTLANVATRVRSWDAPDPATSASQGEHRPWGLKFYRGKLYVGLVLTGQDNNGNVVSPIINGNGSELGGFVYEFDIATQTFIQRLNFGFAYGRERNWIPWGYSTLSGLSRYFSGTEREIAEPIIADIEFDDQGNMLIGLLDRKGHQYAINTNNYAGVLQNYEYSTAGELLRANSSVVNGECVYSIVTRPGTADYYNDNLIHPESVQGPLAVLPGGGDAVAVWLDPIKIRSGGTIRLNNTTGAQVPNSAYEVFDDRFTLSQPGATASKANGLGDIELSGESAPVEIGNLIWADFDGDGIQDSGEPGLSGVDVQLKTPDGTLLATVMTNSNGNYFFNQTNVTDGDPGTPGNQPGPQPNFDYKICIPASEFGDGQPLNNFLVTPPNQTGTGLTDYSDSDGILLGNGDVQIMLTTNDPGENNNTYDFGIIPTDYGDLPDTYGTTEGNNGPWHWISASLKLGNCVDAEINGQPEAMAGQMTGGDDNTTGIGQAGACTGNGDDENGVVFETPMVPGAEACLRITAMNMTSAAAVLQGWIDFNGNGTFDASEQLTTGDFAPSGAAIPVGGVNAQLFCFTVPTTATFQGGQAFSRFRLSANGGLTPGGPGDFGEVEDYKTTLAKVGNLVWNDYNNDGQQNEPGSSGINGVTVQIVWAGPDANFNTTDDNRTYTDVTTTAAGVNGKYDFCGLIAGTYRISVPVSPAGLPTVLNVGSDVTDADDPAGVLVNIPANFALPTGENGLGDNPGGTNGFPDSRDNLTFDFGYVGLDYGDLPDTYGTTEGNEGPAHVVTPDLYLGTCVDGEQDGQPEAMAGLMTAGDDGNVGNGVQGACNPAGDDENGVVFETPMLPGSTACIRVTAHNNTDEDAYLQGWIDFNGNGTFDANEALNSLDFVGDGAVIPSGGVTNAQYCFNVPANATFTGGQAMVRFRLSPDGDLQSGNPTGSTPPLGEVEDYKAPLSKIGNLVWWDVNNNGQQNPGENGLNGVTVELTWLGPNAVVGGGDDVTVTTVTSNMGTDGMYMFLGLTPGMYKLTIPTSPFGFTSTLLNMGNDVTDSDDPTGQMVVIPNPPTTLPLDENGTGDVPDDPNFPDNQNDLTYDFGFVALDYGDLPDTYGTTIAGSGPAHLLDPNLYLGTCVDGETNGQPEAMAGLMTGGDDNNSNPVARLGVCSDGDDENGIVLFETPLIPGYTACIRVTAVNTTGSPAVLQGWIDFNGNGTFDLGEQLVTGNFAPAGAAIPNGGVVNQLMCFEVPVGATFTGGQAMARFRLSTTGGLTPGGPANGPYPIGEVEDYKVAVAKIGTYVWNDNNNDGIQNEPGTNGLNGVTVQMVWGGPDGDVTTAGDNRTYVTTTATMGGNNGQYMFWGLIPGAYKVSVPTNPTGFIPTQLNIGGNENQDADSNTGEMVMVPVLPGLPTGENGTGDTPGGFNGFPDAQDNLQIDFGFVALDYGDLPDNYGTTIVSNGPVHTINPALKLGDRVDSELNGQPEAMAGLMTGGDDNTDSGYNEGGAGDDEDGIVFETPMVPGNQACIRVSAMNMFQANAVLQMWIDFNGDGDVSDAGEAVTTGSFNGAGGGAVVPAGGLNNAQLCFNVPVTATFTGGQAFARFRISTTGNLSPNGPSAMPFPIGEVEDYKLPLAKIGNYVWNDNNNDGIQNEPGSNGLNGTTVQLVWPGPDGDFTTVADNLTYTVVTSNMNGTNGQYMFLGLTPGMYKASIPTSPAGFIPTQLNQGGDVTDSDDPAGQMVVIPNPPTTLPTGENGTGDVPNDPNFPDPQNDLTIDFGFVSVDYGDLPSTYGTTIAEDGPKHIVNPNLKLGSTVDGELNGQPEAMAGFMTGGDDGNNGGYNEGGAGDDENGVTFLTPMIPGYQACIRVNTMNTLGGQAVLQGWVDFNGDGDVTDPGEELSTGSFAAVANGALVPAGASVNTDFCFDVPASATFFGGNAFARFRLSPTGGLTSGGPAAMPYPIGEVEDYKLPLAKAGNYVWIDANINGIQDENGVLGINNVTVELQWAGPDGNFNTVIDNRTYTDITAAEAGINGKYIFCGLIPGNYRMVVPPFGYVPTLVIDVNGNTQDVVDADNPAGVNFTVPNPATTLPTGENGTGDSPLVVNGFPDNQANFTFDFGYLGFDFGDLPETYGTTQGAGNPGPDGAVHTVNPNLYLGPSVDVDIDGQPEAMAGFMTGGDDGNTGPGTLGTSTPAGDDENGISFPTPLIPGSPACVKVTVRNATGNQAILQAWIDFNGDGQFQASEQLTTGNFAPTGAAIPNGGVTNQNFCFDVPANASFNGGNLFARFRLSQSGGQTATGPAIPGNGVFPTGEVEDYKLPLALVGNYVWMDNPDIEGDEDATEMPLANVKINLTWAGEDGVFQTAANSSTPVGDDRVYMDVTDANGRYEFRGLIPSTNYRLLPDKYTAANAAVAAGVNPVDKILTIPNLPPANDNNDSDGAPAMTFSIPNLTNGFLPTGENGLQDNNGGNGFPDNQENLSLDFGFIDEPKIASALAITGFQKASSGVCGHFDVIMDLCVKNNSTAPLASIQAMLDMAAANAYGTTFLGLVPNGAPQIVSSSAQQNPVLNGAYTGIGANKNLFNGTSGLLWPGEQVCIRFRFEVNPTAAGAPANPKAQAMVSGNAQNFQGVAIPDFFNGGAQYVATDLSDAGTDAMSSNPDNPSDLGTANDPTLLGNCWQITQDLVGNDLLHVSISENCETLIGSTQVLEGEADECTEEFYPLGGFYQVKVFNFQNQPIPNPVPLSYIGQTLVYKADHIMTCNTTWGTFILEDKLPPVIECSNITLSCAITNYTPVYLQNVLGFTNAYPTVFDCTPLQPLTFVDTWFDLGCDSDNDLSAYVERIWTVRDAWGNTSSCTQYIYFERRHISDVTLPADVTIDCSDFTATAANPTPSPSITGVPFIADFGLQIPVFPNNTYCELAANYTDEVYEVCDGSFKVLRTWSLVDWCLPNTPTPPLTNPLYYIQLIKVLDEDGPQIACPADITVATNPAQCCATVNLPDVIITDNCSRVDSLGVKIFVYDQYTNELISTFVVSGYLSDFPNNNYWTSDTLGVFGTTPCLPVGTHRVEYLAKDACGNYATCSFNLTVADLIPPVATCTEFTTVAIGSDDPTDCYEPNGSCEFAGVTWVPASAFNQGSFDNCNDVDFTIRRMPVSGEDVYTDCVEALKDIEGCDYNGNGISDEYELAIAENDSIKFYCCEVGTTQTVILRVYQTDLEGNWMTYADGSYIYNECMIQVEVQDKVKPACQPPANVTVSCENFEPSLWAYGYPTVTDNCCLDETPPTSVDPQDQTGIPAGTSAIPGVCGATQKTYYSGFLDANFDTTCNRGRIVRRFTAWDCYGQSSSCTQRITVTNELDYNIEFPTDKTVNCVTEPDFGYPVITNDEGCELIGISYDDVYFTVVPDACYKIERTWTVINWCTYLPDDPCYDHARDNGRFVRVWDGPAYPNGPNPTDNCVTYKQIIKVIDQTPPTVTCAPIDTCDYSSNFDADGLCYWNDGDLWWDNGTQSHNLCETDKTLVSVSATDLCDTIAPEGGLRFRYLLFLDLDNDGTMETVVSSADANTTRPNGLYGRVRYNNYLNPNYGGGEIRRFDLGGNPFAFNIEQTLTGARVTWRTAGGTVQNPNLPHGTHKIKWIAEDGCGNEAVCEEVFTIRDCKRPVVACADVNINLMYGGMATLWASDLFLYGEDNCTPVDILESTVAVIRQDQSDGLTYPAGAPQSIIVTCADQGTNVPVEVWLIDAAGNADFCIAYVNIQANLEGCNTAGTATVAGALATENLQGVEDASVELAIVSTAGQQGVLTQSSSDAGLFQFPNAVPMSGDYTLTPTKDDNPLNGVTTYDLVLISKHILGLEPLTTPYKMIAADANRSGSITTFDIVEFRKLILGIYNELPNNTSWRFVDKAHTFADPFNPFQTLFPENKSVADMQSDNMADDFVGVKIGDVNNTVISNSLQSVDDRTAATMLFDVEDRAVKAGEVFTLNFKGAERVQGYQFTMNMNGLEVQDIIPGTDMKLDNFGVFADAITTSVDGAANEFAVTFRAVKAGKISQMLGVSSRITKAEAYNLTNDRLDVAFRFNSPAGTTISGVGFELYQNQPNPFVNKTFIGFHLPEAANATLRIFDETGRMIFTQNGDFAKGYNTFAIDRQLITTTGLLYYTVETVSDKATKKMIQSK